MTPSVHRSIVKKSLTVVFCMFSVCVLMSPVLAQAAHVPGGVHVSAAPGPHNPISPAPIMHAPISTSRMSTASSGRVALAMGGFRPPRRPIRPFPQVFFLYESPSLFDGAFWGLNSCFRASCDLSWLWTLDYSTMSSPGPANYVYQPYETPVVYGEEGPELPQLFLKDGTILNVTDYWLVDDELHFTMIEEDGGKPVEHLIPFDALDMQRTVDVNTKRGFRFMLRNEPFEQYLRDHPADPPPLTAPAHE